MPKTRIAHPQNKMGVEVVYPEGKKLKSAVYDQIDDCVSVYYENDDQLDKAYKDPQNSSRFVVKCTLQMPQAVTEQECPGLSNLKDNEVRELLIRLAQRRHTSSLPVQGGEWRIGVLAKSEGLRSAMIFYDFDVEE